LVPTLNQNSRWSFGSGQARTKTKATKVYDEGNELSNMASDKT